QRRNSTRHIACFKRSANAGASAWIDRRRRERTRLRAGATLGRGREIDELRKRERGELRQGVLVLALLLGRRQRRDQRLSAAPFLLHRVDDALQAEELRVRGGLEARGDRVRIAVVLAHERRRERLGERFLAAVRGLHARGGMAR